MTSSKSAPNAPEFCKQDNSSATFPADMEGNVEGKEKEHLNQAWATQLRDASADNKPSQKLNANGVKTRSSKYISLLKVKRRCS